MTTNGPVDALLFDLGGVVIDIDFGRVLSRWALASGGDLEALRARFSFDPPYERHERGEIDAREYFACLRASLGIELTDAQFVDGWNSLYIGEISGMAVLLRKLADRIPLYAFTNSNQTHKAVTTVRFAEILKPFRRVFVSCDMGKRKPEPDAFAEIATTIGVPLGRILFFDDSGSNVEAARAIGMPAVHVRSYADVEQAVSRFLG